MNLMNTPEGVDVPGNNTIKIYLLSIYENYIEFT